MNRLEVLLVSPEYPPHHIGGGGVVVRELGQYLSEKKYSVTVLSGYHRASRLDKKPWAVYDGKHKIVFLPLLPVPRVPFQLDTIMPPNLLSARLIYKILRGRRFDIIHLHGYGHLFIDYVAFICCLLRKKYILTIHAFPVTPNVVGGYLKLIYVFYSKTLGRLTLINASRVTTVSVDIARKSFMYGNKSYKTSVIPNNIRLDDYQIPSNALKSFKNIFGISANAHIIIVVGRITRNKGFQYAIKALPLVLKEIPNVKLLIVGRDEGYKLTLDSLIKALGLNDKVIYTGFADLAMKKRILAVAEILIIPSLYEPFGLVALEGMATEKAIIASRVGGLSEILTDNTAVLVQPGRYKEIAYEVIELLKRPKWRQKLSENAKKEVLNFSWEKKGISYLEVYDLFMQQGRQ